MRESFVKLFNTSVLGLNLKRGQGARDSKDQSRMRAAMLTAYGGSCASAWDPVLGFETDAAAANAAHLFPYRSAGCMDSIFGEDDIKELFSPLNGLFLHHNIEAALDKGIIAIIPNIDLNDNDIGSHPALDDVQLAAWQAQPVKNYKVWILDKKNQMATTMSFNRASGYPIQTIAGLHNRPLRFQNDVWTFLAGIISNVVIHELFEDGIVTVRAAVYSAAHVLFCASPDVAALWAGLYFAFLSKSQVAAGLDVFARLAGLPANVVARLDIIAYVAP